MVEVWQVSQSKARRETAPLSELVPIAEGNESQHGCSQDLTEVAISGKKLKFIYPINNYDL